MNNSHHGIDEEIRRIRSARLNCPSPDELASHLSGELPEEEARLLEVHLHNCPSCVRVVERLRNPDKVRASSADRKRQAQDIDDVAQRLGFEKSAGNAGLLGMLDWLWRVKVPLYVPVAAGIALLLLVVYSGQLTTEPPIELLGAARFIGLEQSASRSVREDTEIEQIGVGEVVIIDYRVDDPDLLPGDSVHCVVAGGQGEREVIDAIIGPEYSLLIPLQFSAPGTFHLQLHRQDGETPFDTFTLVVKPQAPSDP